MKLIESSRTGHGNRADVSIPPDAKSNDSVLFRVAGYTPLEDLLVWEQYVNLPSRMVLQQTNAAGQTPRQFYTETAPWLACPQRPDPGLLRRIRAREAKDEKLEQLQKALRMAVLELYSLVLCHSVLFVESRSFFHETC